MTSDQKIAVLIPDAENYLLLHVLNCLASTGNYLIYLLMYEKSGTKYSRYVANCSIYPKTDDSIQRMENINLEVLKRNIDVIMPIHDACVADLIQHRKYITYPERIVQLPSFDAYTIATNKGLLALHLKSYGFPCPVTWVYCRGNEVSWIECNFPCIVKPSTNSHGGYGVKLVESVASLKEYLDTYRTHNEFVIQEYFKGEDWGCSILALNGIVKAYCFQRTILHQKNKFAPAIGIELMPDAKPLDTVEKLVKSLNWCGVAHLDLRYNKENDQFVIIEMNARYWASIEAGKFGGINFPQLHIQLSTGKDFPLPTYNSIEYLKSSGVLQKLRKNIGLLFNFKFLRSKTEFASIIRDPVPTIFRIVAKIKRNLVHRNK